MYCTHGINKIKQEGRHNLKLYQELIRWMGNIRQGLKRGALWPQRVRTNQSFCVRERE